MIQIDYKDIGIFNVPTEWNEITLDLFQKVEELEFEEEIDRDIAFLSVLTGISSEKILDLPLTEFNKLKGVCAFMHNNEIKEKPKLVIEIDGKKYGYRHNITKMSVAEYIDCDTLSSCENSAQQLHTIMAILYRPVVKHGDLEKDPTDYTIEKYDSETVEERAKLFKQKMTVDIVLSAMSFMLAHVTTSLEHIQGSSEKEQIL